MSAWMNPAPEHFAFALHKLPSAKASALCWGRFLRLSVVSVPYMIVIGCYRCTITKFQFNISINFNQGTDFDKALHQNHFIYGNKSARAFDASMNTGVIARKRFLISWPSPPQPSPQIAKSMGQHGAHLGPVGPRWAPCWPHKPCYLGPCEPTGHRSQNVSQNIRVTVALWRRYDNAKEL